MRTSLTLVLVVLNICIFSIVYYFEKYSDRSKEDESKTFLFLEGQVSKLDRIELSGENLPQARVLERRNERWFIISPIEWPANDFAVQRIITQLQFLEKEASFPVSEVLKSGHSLADYGLDNPKLILTLKAGDKYISLKIGDPTPVGNRLYILSATSNYIFVMNKELMESLSVNIEDLRGQNLFEIPLFEIRGLSIQVNEPASSKIRLVEQNQEWLFEAPMQAKASKQAVERTLSQLTSARIRSFVPIESADAEKLGLATPWLRISLYGNNRRQSLLLGNEVSNEEGKAKAYYARLESLPTFFTVNASIFDSLREAQVTLRELKLIPFNLNQLQGIDIVQGDQEVQLQKLESGTWQVLAKDAEGRIVPMTADQDLMQEIIRSLNQLEAEELVSDAPSVADLEHFGFLNPQRTVTLSSENEKVSLLFGNLDTKKNLVYVKLENANSVFEVFRGALNLLPARPFYFKDRILEEWPSSARIQSLQITDLRTKDIVFQATIDPKTQEWNDYLEKSAESKKEAILDILEQLHSFSVQEYLDGTFKDTVRLDNYTELPWRYKINATVYLPTSQGAERYDPIEYYLTERIGGSLQLGGSPRYGVTFALPQKFIDGLFIITFNKKFPAQYNAGNNNSTATTQSKPAASSSSANKAQ